MVDRVQIGQAEIFFCDDSCRDASQATAGSVLSMCTAIAARCHRGVLNQTEGTGGERDTEGV